ncbi:MAG: hypothetical protein K2X27_17015 [Candidatus Obscuribacterales bacterium]|nr:hypothetical protein [Candidatus Obscuribacterales bacterium]
MFGFEFKKSAPTTYVILHQSGRVVKQGPGLSFWYFAPFCTVMDVPLNSQDVSFIFTEVTSDFQELSVQGQLSYRISAPETTSQMLEFSVDKKGKYLAATDENPMDLLGARLINATQVIAQSVIRPLPIREILKQPQAMVAGVLEGLKKSEVLGTLGVQVLDLAVLAITPSREMARALESETRERIQQQSDQAIYARRNAAVEEERRIKESELKTEIAVEEKRREIRETKMAADIALEAQRATLVDSKIENDKKEADSHAYALEATLKQVQQVDWKTLMAMAAKGGDSKLAMSMAFQELAENAAKIGQINLTPDLLQSLLADHGQNGNSNQTNSAHSKK